MIADDYWECSLKILMKTNVACRFNPAPPPPPPAKEYRCRDVLTPSIHPRSPTSALPSTLPSVRT
jgi:hypothetical protein